MNVVEWQACVDPYLMLKHFDQHPLKREECIRIKAKRSDLPNLLFKDYHVSMTIGIGGRLSYGHYNAHRYKNFYSSVYVVPLQVASIFRTIPSIRGQQRCSENKSIDMCTSECWRDYLHGICCCCPTLGNMVSRGGSSTSPKI